MPHSEIYPGNEIGDNFFSGHFVLIRQDNVIGDNVSVGSYTEIAHHVTIGDNTRIHSKCFIPEYTVIGRNVWIGPCVTICNDPYPTTKGKHLAPVQIHDGAIIGAGAVLLPGVRIEKNSVVGAGSVVTKNVREGWVVFGNPATPQKYKSDIGAYNDPSS